MGSANNKNLSIKYYGLRYTNENDLSFQRRRHGRGFQFINLNGEVIKNKNLIKRFKDLVIPPAWDDVRICNFKNGHIQVTGKDNKGRKQYIYHEKWEEFSSSTKFNRLIEFGELLPKIRKRIDKDFRRRTFSKDKVLSLILKILEETLIRIGNEKYAEENNSYGLTTLRNKHLKKMDPV